MKLLLDQGVPRTAARLLRESGLDAVHVGEISMDRATDREIIEFAGIEGRICITLDADFHALLALSGTLAPSVIRIRQEGLNGIAVFKLVQAALASAAEALEQGALITATGRTLRIHRLPVKNSKERREGGCLPPSQPKPTIKPV